MRGLSSLLTALACFLPVACSGPGNEGQPDSNNAAAAASNEVDGGISWVSGGPDCPVETGGWTVTIREQVGSTPATMRVLGYVRSTDARVMANTLSPVDPVRTTPPTQHFEIAPLLTDYPAGQAEQRFTDTMAIHGLTAVVIDCNGKEIARVTKFDREPPGQSRQ